MTRLRSPEDDRASARQGRRIGLTPVICGLVLVAATLVTFWPVTEHGFVNWDDQDVVAANADLQRPLPSLVGWAFTTRHMGHYQPLSWLALAPIAGQPPSPARVHAAAVLVHAANAALLMLIAAALLPRRDDAGDERWWVALSAAALFAVHPLRLEPVAWASALPYLLSYLPLLGSLLCWIAWVRSSDRRAYWAAVGLFAISQLTRVTAPLAPLVFIVVAPVVPGARPLAWAALARAATPLVFIAAPLAIVEASARQPETLDAIGIGPRLAWALLHPLTYLWRAVAPGLLNPLDPLPRVAVANWDVTVVAALGLVLVVALTIALASRRAALATWGSYGLLLLPVVGLVPSGLQLTADRYAYGPAMVLSAALAAVMHRLPGGAPRGLALMAAGGAAVLLGRSVQAQTPMWRDSVSLWSQAAAVNADNDVALYNLALAEEDAGETDRAIERLQRLVALVPDHDLGRERLTRLVADREERRGHEAAAGRRWPEAAAAYDRALDADATRTRVRISRGMALVELGRLAQAAPDLEAGLAGGVDDAAVVNALAYAWSATGRTADALELLERGRTRHPEDRGMTANLARLLVTAEPPPLRDPDRALALAAALNDATGGRDVRVLDTLALALAAAGRPRDAAEALDVAISLAEDAGDRTLAAAMTTRRRALTR